MAGEQHVIYGLGDGYIAGTKGTPSKDLSVSAVIPKDVFVSAKSSVSPIWASKPGTARQMSASSVP